MKTIKVAEHLIGDGHPCFVVAEIGSNHRQSLELAKKMITAAAECGADAVKFQSLDYDAMYAFDHKELRTLYEKIKLDHRWYPELKSHADKNKTIFFSCPCYMESIDLLEQLQVTLYKIASPQTRAFPQLIRAAAETGKPLIISTGYCRDEHVKRAVRICEETQNFRYILLQCTSQYPVKPEDVNLSVMDEFRKYGGPVGLSDHSKGIHMAVAAVARGANVIEKHFSLDPQGAGPDDVVSLNPQEFTMMVEHIRDTEKAIGTRNKRVLQEEEAIIETDHLLYRVVAARDLTVGETLNGNVIYKRAPGGITAEEEQDWTGKKLVRDVKKGAILQWTDLEP